MAYALRVCEKCGSDYRPTYGKQRTCGRQCGRELRFGPGGRRVAPVSHIARYGDCTECGSLFVDRRGNKLTCSPLCAARRTYPATHAWYRRNHPPYEQVHICEECRQEFVATVRIKKFCRSSCAIRAQRRSRRALDGRSAIAIGTRQRVYARDDDQCHLCRWVVWFEESDAAHTWLATVDHLVPHSLGGTDDEDNLATAHRWCNTLRGNAPVDLTRSVLAGNPPPDTWDVDEYRTLAAAIADSLTAAA